MSLTSQRTSRSNNDTPEPVARLRLFRRESACRVLGPDVRAVLWVQGCTLRCAGCLASRAWDATGAETADVRELADWLLALEGVEGVTLSGGEPMQQAAACAYLLELVRSRRDLGVVCYTGYRLESLRTVTQRALLNHVDLLIDGPYEARLHEDLLWRASSNQRLLPLTDRYKHALPRSAEEDRSVGLELVFSPDGRFAFAGVPPWPDYARRLRDVS